MPKLKYKEPPTKEFLEELTERARKYGWEGDYYEVVYFVESLYREAEIEVPDELDDVID